MTVRFKETKVSISFWFAFGITVFLLFDSTKIVLINIISAMLHECGHCIAMIIFKENPKKIEVTPFGMRIRRNAVNKMSFNREIVVALSGPSVNFVIFGVSYFLNFRKVADLNLILGVFNLLPCEPLDGYRVIHFLLLRKLAEEKADKISDLLSAIVIAFVLASGVLIFYRSKYNFSMILVSGYLISFLISKRINI